MSNTATATNAGAFLPTKVKQEGPKRTATTKPKAKKASKPAAKKAAPPAGRGSDAEIAFRQNMIFTTGDERELDRIEDYLREQGIRRLDRSKLLRMALRAAFQKDVDLSSLLAEVVAADRRHRSVRRVRSA